MKVVSNFKNILFGLIILFIFGSVAYSVEYRGVNTAYYEGIYTKKKVREALAVAKEQACLNAFKKYIQGLEESKRMIFESLKDQIFQNINDYMTCATVVEEAIDKKDKKVSVVMKANIDETRLDIEITKSSKVFDSTTGEKSSLATIFFSRTVTSEKGYDDKVTDIEQVTSSIEVDEEETETGISSEATATSITTTGGSTTLKEDVVKYKVDDTDSVNLAAGMKEIFTKARFEPSSAKRAVRRGWPKFKNEIIASLESGGGIPEEVQWDIEDILMEKNYNYVVFAYFDVGIAKTDPATGNKMVIAALNIAEILRLGDGDPVSLGTISGVQMRGKGSDSASAKANALNLVAKDTGKKLVALINSKGIN